MTTTRPEAESQMFANPDPSWLPSAEVSVPRDDKERPLIVPPGGTEPVPYERVSRVAEAVDTKKWLLDWYMGLLAKGMGMSPELGALAAGLEWNDPRMADLIARCHDRAGGNVKADWGTAVHLHTEDGADPSLVPPDMAADVASYRLAHEQAEVTIVRTEVFVVNDELRTAGTLDAVIWCPQLEFAVEDKKSGKFAAKTCAVQTAIYARSSSVDMDAVAEGRWAEREALDVNLDRAVIAHIPRLGGATTLRKVDIARGWELAKLARTVHELAEAPDWVDPEPLGKISRKETIAAGIAACTTIPELRDLMEHSQRWFTKALTAQAHERWAAIRAEARRG